MSASGGEDRPSDGLSPPRHRRFYGNEKENGEGFRASGLKREEVFICTKVRNDKLMPDDFARSVDESLGRSGIALRGSAADPLEQQGHSVQAVGRRAVQGEEGRQGQACRRRQFHHHDAGRSLGGDLRAAGLQPDRAASLHQPGQGAGGEQEARHGGGRLLPERARQGRPGAEALERIGKAHGKSSAQVGCAIWCSWARLPFRARPRRRT